MEEEASHFLRLNDEWLEALEQVRRLDGFQNFLRPKRISTLLGSGSKAPLVILNACNAGCAALILSSTGVQHVPFPKLSLANLAWLVELMQIATAPGSRDGSKDLVLQMPPLSDTLWILRQTLERGGMIQSTRSDMVFRFVLTVLWEAVIEPVIRQLRLEVTFYIRKIFLLELTSFCRNLKNHHTCDGAPQDHSLFFHFMQQGCMISRRRCACLTMSFRRTHRPSVPFFARHPFLPVPSRWW